MGGVAADDWPACAAAGRGPWLVAPRTSGFREHARLESAADGVVLHDSGSKNGTSSTGRRWWPKGSMRLSDGDLIGVGRSLLLVRHEVATHARTPRSRRWSGVSAVASELRQSIMQAAQSDRPVLLLGETGTGKEVAAMHSIA